MLGGEEEHKEDALFMNSSLDIFHFALKQYVFTHFTY